MIFVSHGSLFASCSRKLITYIRHESSIARFCCEIHDNTAMEVCSFVVGRNPLAVGNDRRNPSRFEELVVSPQATSYLRLTSIADCSNTNPMSTISSTMLSPLPSRHGQPHPPGPGPKSGSISEISSRSSLRSMLFGRNGLESVS